MIKHIEVDFDIMNEVFLKGRVEKEIGHVIYIIVDVQGVMYGVSWVDSGDTSRHYGFELSRKYEKRWEDGEEESDDDLDDE